MEIKVYQNYEEMALHIAGYIADFVHRKPDALLCFPSGDTPSGVFKQLVVMDREGKVDFRHCTFVGLDEWVGLGRDDQGSCEGFMYDHLFVPLGIDESSIHFFDAKAADLRAECIRMDRLMEQKGPIDLMFLGIGMNGHLGLNEPGVDFASTSSVVQLDEVTRSVGQKYFQNQTRLERGITLGIKQIMDSRTVILGASGAKKANIVRQAVRGEVTNRVPGSILQRHGHSVVFLDREAAAGLEGTV